MQKNMSKLLLIAFLGLSQQVAIVASQYPLINPSIGPSSLKTGTQPFSAMTISGANTNPIIMSTTQVDNITVAFTYSPAAEDINVVTFSIDFTKLNPAAPIPAAVLAAGVSVQVSLVEAANTLSFPNINSFQKSYFWNAGPTAANTLIVLILGADGTVYAAGACTGFFLPNFAPIAYQVSINNGLTTQMSTVQIPVASTTTQGVKIQSGSVSNQKMVTYPLFNSTIWGVAAPTNPSAFSAVSVHANASSKVVMGINNLQNIKVSFNYTTTSVGAVTSAIDLTQFDNITPQVLQAGLFLQIDLVPAAQATSYAAASLYAHSYFWNGPSAVNTMYISLVDGSGNIYAAGGCAGTIASQYTPTSYMVTINSGTDTQMETQPIVVNGASTSVVAFQSGVASTQNMVSFPLFNSTVWGVAAPTNPVAFNALSILGNAQNNITLGVDEINNITVNFDYTTSKKAVSYSVDLTQYDSISTSVLQAGLFVKIDLVPSSLSTSYPSVNLIPHSYFWKGASSTNTMFVSLVDGSGNVYAAGGCTGTIVSQYTPTAYNVIINSSSLEQISTLSIPITAGNGQGVMIKSGVVSSPANLISSPIFMSTIWGVPAPTNAPAFNAVTGQVTGTGVITLGANDIKVISVDFNYGSSKVPAVTFGVDVANIVAITPAILQAGLFIKTDLVPANAVASYPAISMIPQSYFWGGPSVVANTIIVSLLDAQGTIYAIGACTGTIASEFLPTNYIVTVQGENKVSVSSAAIPFTAGFVPAVLVQFKSNAPAAPAVIPTAPVTGTTPVSTSGTVPLSNLERLTNFLKVHKAVAALTSGANVATSN